MRKLSIVLIFLFTTILISSAIGGGSYPDWILPELKQYPIDKYIFDIGRSKGRGEEAIKEAIAKAHEKLAEKILKQVIGIISLNKGNVNYKTVLEHYSAVLEDYCSGHHASPALQLKGLEFQNLSIKNARTENETFAIVFIERKILKQIYKNHVADINKEIEHRLKIAENAEDDLKRDKAIKAYYRTYPLYEALKEAEIIQIGAEYPPKFDDGFRRLATAATAIDGNPLPHRQVIKRLRELEKEKIVFFKDIIKVIDSQLSKQIVPPNRSVAVHPLVYQDSEMFSPFARKFTETLIQVMPEWVFVDPTLELKQPPIDIDKFNQEFPDLRISSSYWENGEEINIRATLRDINTGEFLASAVVQYLKSDLRDTLTYMPGGYDQAQLEKEVFHPRYFVIERPRGDADEVLTEHEFSPVGGLKVDLWTNKGRGPLHFTEGNQVKIYARVNQPAYLRLLYTLADQRRTLLVDSFYISEENVNIDVEIGEFACDPPFGVEFLNVAARTEKFPVIKTFEKDGYFFLEDQDPKKAVRKYRGLKRIPKKRNEQQFIGPKPIIDKQPSFQQAEAQLVITIEEK